MVQTVSSPVAVVEVAIDPPAPDDMVEVVAAGERGPFEDVEMGFNRVEPGGLRGRPRRAAGARLGSRGRADDSPPQRKGKRRIRWSRRVIIELGFVTGSGPPDQRLARGPRFLRRTGYEARLTSRSPHGHWLLKRQVFDAANLDIGMPDMDGLTLLEELKGFDATIEVVIITGNPMVSTAVRALKGSSP